MTLRNAPSSVDFSAEAHFELHFGPFVSKEVTFVFIRRAVGKAL
jgi:hypothetical protein